MRWRQPPHLIPVQFSLADAPWARDQRSLERVTLFVRFDRRTRAHQVLVAVDVIEPSDRGPELVLAHPGHGKGRAVARIRPVPAVVGEILRGVRRALEQVLFARRLAALDLADLLAAADHLRAEAVALALRLALCGL